MGVHAKMSEKNSFLSQGALGVYMLHTRRALLCKAQRAEMQRPESCLTCEMV